MGETETEATSNYIMFSSATLFWSQLPHMSSQMLAQTAAPSPRGNSHSEGLEWAPRICISINSQCCCCYSSSRFMLRSLNFMAHKFFSAVKFFFPLRLQETKRARRTILMTLRTFATSKTTQIELTALPITSYNYKHIKRPTVKGWLKSP